MIQTNKTGQSKADNIIDELLGFNFDSNWTVTGLGSANVVQNNFFEGSGSLYIENNRPTDSITTSNTTQLTTVDVDGSYWLSLRLYKNLPDVVLTGEVQIFKNSILFNTQTFSFGSKTTDEDSNEVWTRFVADQPFQFNKQDVITLKFKIDGIVAYTDPSTSLFVDAVKLGRNDSGNSFPSAYSESINKKPYINQTDAPLVPLNKSLNWCANGSGTSNGVSYEKGDYLITINVDGVQKTAILIDYSVM